MVDSLTELLKRYDLTTKNIEYARETQCAVFEVLARLLETIHEGPPLRMDCADALDGARALLAEILR